MQDINHDMEELLRRAAIDYPLVDGDDRWDEIAQRLSQTNDVSKTNTRNFQPAYKALLLFLFLHAFLFLNRYVIHQSQSKVIKNENSDQIRFPLRDSAFDLPQLALGRKSDSENFPAGVERRARRGQRVDFGLLRESPRFVFREVFQFRLVARSVSSPRLSGCTPPAAPPVLAAT